MCPRLPLLLCVLSFAAPCHAVGVSISAFSERGRDSQVHGGYLLVSVPLDRWAAGRVTTLDALGSSAAGTAPSDPGAWLQTPLPRFDLPLPPLDTLPVRNVTAPPPHPEPVLPSMDGSGLAGEGAAAGLAGEGAVAEGSVPETPQASEPLRAAGVDAPVVGQWQPPFALVRRLIAAAVREHERRTRRLESLASRSKSSAWLPDVRVRGGRNVDQTVRLTPTTDDPNRWQLTGGADWRFEAQLSWQFDRLLFADEELAVERLRLQAAVRRAQLVDSVLDWLLRWQSARFEALDPLGEPRGAQLAELRAAHAQSVLDVLTAGWFSAHATELAGPVTTP